jgi:glycosyltransferase involved in cell wall biosynthesis
MQTPLVSVCVPSYNYGRFLPDCIESVQKQTFSDWELVITDDCSTDRTEDVVRTYAAEDPRIRYICNERRLGMNPNLKRAADSGRGRYLKILCADDWLMPRCLEVLYNLMEQYPNAVLATSAECYTDQFGNPQYLQNFFGKPITVLHGEAMLDRVARGHGLGGNSSFLIRTSAYHEVGGYDGSLLYASDYDLGARLCRVGDYIHSDEPLFYGRKQPEGSSSVNPKKLYDVKDWFAIPDKIFRPRVFPNREWRRYKRITALLTARYLVTMMLEYIRGHRDYARGLARIVMQNGNFLFGLAYVPVHAAGRAYRRLIGKNHPTFLPPEPWMGLPSVGRSVTVAHSVRTMDFPNP